MLKIQKNNEFLQMNFVPGTSAFYVQVNNNIKRNLFIYPGYI
jgi:hypothetical protein